MVGQPSIRYTHCQGNFFIGIIDVRAFVGEEIEIFHASKYELRDLILQILLH